MSKHDTVRYTVDLNREDVLWFKEHFPKASMSGILEALFSSFRQVSDKTQKHYIEEATKRLAEEIRR